MASGVGQESPMEKREPEEGGEQEAPREVTVKVFSISYETLVKAFIGCLIALMAWSYNEITSLRQNKADKVEVYREVASIKDALRDISEGVKRVENLHFNAKSSRQDMKWQEK
jgi:hypothetical protein